MIVIAALGGLAAAIAGIGWIFEDAHLRYVGQESSLLEGILVAGALMGILLMLVGIVGMVVTGS